MDLNSEIERLTRERDEARAAYEKEKAYCVGRVRDLLAEFRAAEQDAARLAEAMREIVEHRYRAPVFNELKDIARAALAAHEARVGGGGGAS